MGTDGASGHVSGWPALLLEGKVAVITGAGSGVGRATALLFASAGAAVLCGDLREEWVESTAQMITESGGRAAAMRCDVTSENDITALIGVARARFGRLDIMHNNAGISTPGLSIGDHDDAEWERLVGVNLRGCFLGSKRAVAAFDEQGSGGAIINTSSISGLVGFGGAVYGLTKGGVNQLTKALAVEVAPRGIRVNALCPGPMFTNLTRPAGSDYHEPTEDERAAYGSMNPTGVAVQPEDVADAALFLASDRARAITGVLLPVDHGFTCR